MVFLVLFKYIHYVRENAYNMLLALQKEHIF